MAGWSKIVDGSALDCLKSVQKLNSRGFCLDLKLNSQKPIDGTDEDKLRCLFKQLLCVFLKKICGSDCIRPLPPMLGNGQPVDLFKLFLVVREKGGYETVSRNNQWNLVAEELGLGSAVGSAVKLIYVKYLDSLDKWLQRIVKDKEPKGTLQDSIQEFSTCLMELDPEYRVVSSEIPIHIKKEKEISPLDSGKRDLKFRDLRELSNGIKVDSSVKKDVGTESVDGKQEACDGKDHTFTSRKRKRDSDQGMLEWLVEVAKNPCSHEIGSLPDRSMWKCYGTEQIWKQVLLAREAIFVKRVHDVRADQPISNWLMMKMHPSMYDDYTGSDRLRSSPRLLSAKDSKESRAQGGSASHSGSESDLDDRPDNKPSKEVPVGPLYQANIPEWTGETHGSESRWIGSQVWPLENQKGSRFLIERERIGKGRQDSCGCQNPGSVECVRFHVAEKKKRVKLELGLAFHRWKLDKMGEEVALSWTKEEERRFQTIIKSNPPSLDKCFWDEMFKSFSSKSREDLVSYYFNVYLLRRRGDQNRSTPSNIDSDDEESEFASLANRFGREAAKSPGSIFHSPKKQNLNKR